MHGYTPERCKYCNLRTMFIYMAFIPLVVSFSLLHIHRSYLIVFGFEICCKAFVV